MKEYHKIQTVFLRSPESNFKTVLEGRWALPEFEFLKDAEWVWTEKVNGTNIRVIWDGVNIKFLGKTDVAQIPGQLLPLLQETFTREKMKTTFDGPCCLYGEGFGKNIQSAGKRYISGSAGFILFDCLIGDFWLERHNLENIAGKFNIPIVPIVGQGNLVQAVEIVEKGFKSLISEDRLLPAEGLILKPKVELFNRKGERIITKIKFKDFPR